MDNENIQTPSMLTNHGYLCCKHCLEEDYECGIRYELMNGNKKNILKIGAVASLCLPGSNSKSKLQ